MTCEIDINTDRVWQTGSYMLVGRRANFDALWNSINRLDSVLESLRAYDNASGTVTRNVDKAQQNLRKCRTQCIDVTTNAMVRTGNFLQDVAIEYEASERYVKSLWDDNYTHRSWSFTKDDLASLISQAGKLIAKDPLAFVATFAAECAEVFVKAWGFVSPLLGWVAEAVTIAALVSFAFSNPVGWIVLGAYAVSLIYKYTTGGNSIIGDALSLGVELVTGDKELAARAKTIGSFAQDVAELCLPGGLLAKGAAKAIKGAQGATKAANLLKKGNKVTTFLRKPSKVLTTTFKRLAQSNKFGRASSKVHSFANAVSVKNNPMKYLTSKYAPSKGIERKINKAYDKFSFVKRSGSATSGVCDYLTQTDEERAEHKNPLSDVWHSCFG